MNVSFSSDDLSEKAKALFSFHDEILFAFQFNARIVLANDRLSPIGRYLFCTSIERNYMNCKNVLNYVAEHPETQINSSSLPPLLILCGAARTGSTLLYNLLACDPASRAPTLFDMLHPVPPIARSNSAAQAQRNILANSTIDKLNKLELVDCEQEQQASHPSYTYEEDVNILYQAGLLVPHLEPYNSDQLANWFYDEMDKDFVYKYHKIFMQMLNSVDAPQSHWVLKTPYHTFNLNALLRHYPSALLIMTHRPMQDVVPSSIRLGFAFGRSYFDWNRPDAEIDKQTIVNRRMRATDVQIDRIMKFRQSHPNMSVCDVLYDDLIRNPIDTVHRIYDHFQLKWSEDFERAMLTWLHENPQGKQGRNAYSMEEYGLTDETIEKRYERYTKTFLTPNTSS